ncbi:MAG: alpha/beta fold hydrolase [Nitrospinaceae bacterium]|nr:alpha/beta fold hydrolase [Nitrospinaceae bacterium]
MTNLYPFSSHSLQLDRLRYHYLDEGSGENLLMLHGNPTWSFYYRNLILGLKGSYRCVVPDHMGMGKSDKPQDYPYTLSRHIDNLEKLADHLELDDITLVVHDWGGAIGMGFAVRHPERIRRLVIFNTAAFLSSEIPLGLSLCRIPGFGAIAIRGFNVFARGAIRWACVKQERMTEEVRAGYLAPYDNFANRVANLRFVQDIPISPDSPSYSVIQHIEENLKLFREHPVQIIWGAHDFVFNDHFLKRWQEIFPQAEVHRMEDAGHYVVEDAHERILPLLYEFLQKNPI